MKKKGMIFLKRHKRLLIILALVAGIAVAAGNIAVYMYGNWRAEQTQKELEALAKQTPVSTPTPTPKSTPTPPPTPGREIDFASLQKQNSDIIAWIEIPGTVIDYAVVQGEDNEYYLDHNALLEEDIEGAIFVDAGNAPGFSDPNTVIYGHRMNNGNMFAGLHQFEEEAFFKTHRVLNLYEPEGLSEYEIFAAYETDDAHLLSKWDYSSGAEWERYLEEIGSTDSAAMLRDTPIEKTDRILTLSTCVRGEDAKRYFVQAVLRPDGVEEEG